MELIKKSMVKAAGLGVVISLLGACAVQQVPSKRPITEELKPVIQEKKP